MNEPVKLSDFVIIEYGDQCAWIINTLTRGVITCSPEIASKLESISSITCTDELNKNFDDNLLKGLFSLGVFVDITIDELTLVKQLVNEAVNDQSTVGFVISPTLSCNCDCHYCFEKNVRDSSEEIDAVEILKFIKEKSIGKKSMTIQWFGGEPLQRLNFLEKVSLDVIKHCAIFDIDLSFSLVTNGVLLTRDVAERLVSFRIFDVQVTLEGGQNFHDKIRFTDNGTGTFHRIINSIMENGDLLNFSLRVHVAPYNLDSVLELISHLGDLKVGKKLQEIYFAPLFDYKTSEDRVFFVHGNQKFLKIEDFSKIEPTLYSGAKAQGLPLPKIFDEGYGICTAVRNNTYVIDPAGRVHRCYFFLGDAAESYGNIGNDLIKEQNLTKWLDIDVPRDDECGSCKLLPVCLGGCSVKWMSGAPKSVICDSLRYNLKEMLPVFYPL